FDAKALLLLVPRHPERFDKVAKLCQNTPFRVLRRSQMKEEVKEIDIFLGDTLGELLTFYAASDVAFVGGSLVQVGGHNVLEPIMVEVPVILGMHFFNAVSIVKRLEKAKAI